jgi:hypothetical protein
VIRVYVNISSFCLRALKPPPAHDGGQAVRSPEFAVETPNGFASRQPRRTLFWRGGGDQLLEARHSG